MRPDDREALIRLYSDRLDRHGVSSLTLGWGEKDRRALRFEILCSRWNLEGARILDFGCGFGDLYGYLAATGARVDYTGVDINARLVAEAAALHPAATFEAGDLLDADPACTYDYVLASGVFNDRIGDNAAFTAGALAMFARLARKGFAANFLSAKADVRYPHAHYTEPADALELCYRHSRNVVLRNDYMPFEFTVFVDTAARVDPVLTIFDTFSKTQGDPA